MNRLDLEREAKILEAFETMQRPHYYCTDCEQICTITEYYLSTCCFAPVVRIEGGSK